jgi:tetratricopeptide (TPR) repeat protein
MKSHPGSPSRRLLFVALIGAFLGGLIVGIRWFWTDDTPRIDVAGADVDDEPEPVVQNPGYLGPDACAECHAKRVAEFRGTNHFRACRRPADGEMPPGFAPGHGTLPTSRPDVHFEMTHAANEYYQVTVRTGPEGDHRSFAQIGHVFGAGGLDEVNFAWHDDRLTELPVAWLHPLGQWGHVPLNLNAPGDLGREGTFRCQECHNTWFAHVPGSIDRYKPDSFLFGVTCERCHGPGREHVTVHKSHPGHAAAEAIVHPGHLARERQMEICTQCHSNAITRRDPPFSYRPGEPLAEHFRTLVTRHPEDDHVANQVKYLQESKCFQHSDSMTCVTCHNPHRPTDHAAVQKSCLKCHEPAACQERPRVPAGVRDDCAGCHMPPRIWVNVHFHTANDRFVPPIRRSDHRIAIHPVARDRVVLEWYRKHPEADTQHEAERLAHRQTDYWLAEADARQRDHRFLAAIAAAREAAGAEVTPAVRHRLADAIAAQSEVLDDLVEAEALIDAGRYPGAVNTLKRLLKLKPDFPEGHSQLGKAYAGEGRLGLAIEQWREEARCDPNSSYGYVMIGWLALLEGKADEALEMYRRADEISPFDAEIKYRLGWALELNGRFSEAEAVLRRATAIDPGHVHAYERLSEILRREGHAEESISPARRAAKLTHFKDADALMTLAEADAAAGHRKEAEEFGVKAMQIAPPDHIDAIRARLDAVRAGH